MLLFFGKKSFRAAPREAAMRLGALVQACTQPEVEQAREWLVLAGQLEQAVLDAGGPDAVCEVTDRAASLFMDLRARSGPDQSRRVLIEAIAHSAQALQDEAATFRLPEGYAWYALYPDGYAETAAQWAETNTSRTVSVVGLRSIGTSLGAVVAEALRRKGVAVRHRLTVRPQGHPFARESVLPRGACAAGDAWIIVDEGPGLSGSSMASVADALQRDGVDERDIVFFCGHGKGPGPEADAAVRRWWTPERCWFTATEALHPTPDAGSRLLFGGFAAVNARLDTLTDIKLERQARLHEKGIAMAARRLSNGWMAITDEGTPLTVVDLHGSFIRKTLARYIAAASCPAEGEDDSRHAIARVAEALAQFGAEDMRGYAERAERETGCPHLAGDGRLGPEQWTRLADGRVLKRDATGTEWGHDWSGPQPILWDVAGAAAEWDMPADATHALCTALAEDHGIVVMPLALAFHEAGYCVLGLARARHEGDGVQALKYEARLRAALARMAAAP